MSILLNIDVCAHTLGRRFGKDEIWIIYLILEIVLKRISTQWETRKFNYGTIYSTLCVFAMCVFPIHFSKFHVEDSHIYTYVISCKNVLHWIGAQIYTICDLIFNNSKRICFYIQIRIFIFNTGNTSVIFVSLKDYCHQYFAFNIFNIYNAIIFCRL